MLSIRVRETLLTDVNLGISPGVIFDALFSRDWLAVISTNCCERKEEVPIKLQNRCSIGENVETHILTQQVCEGNSLFCARAALFASTYENWLLHSLSTDTTYVSERICTTNDSRHVGIISLLPSELIWFSGYGTFKRDLWARQLIIKAMGCASR